MSGKFNEELLSAYLDDELSSEQRADVEQLLSQNAECQRMLNELRVVREELQLLPRLSLGEQFTQRIQNEIDKNHRGTHLSEKADQRSGATKARRHWNWRTVAAFGYGVAATLLFMFLMNTAKPYSNVFSTSMVSDPAGIETADSLTDNESDSEADGESEESTRDGPDNAEAMFVTQQDSEGFESRSEMGESLLRKNKNAIPRFKRAAPPSLASDNSKPAGDYRPKSGTDNSVENSVPELAAKGGRAPKSARATQQDRDADDQANRAPGVGQSQIASRKPDTSQSPIAQAPPNRPAPLSAGTSPLGTSPLGTSQDGAAQGKAASIQRMSKSAEPTGEIAEGNSAKLGMHLDERLGGNQRGGELQGAVAQQQRTIRLDTNSDFGNSTGNNLVAFVTLSPAQIDNGALFDALASNGIALEASQQDANANGIPNSLSFQNLARATRTEMAPVQNPIEKATDDESQAGNLAEENPLRQTFGLKTSESPSLPSIENSVANVITIEAPADQIQNVLRQLNNASHIVTLANPRGNAGQVSAEARFANSLAQSTTEQARRRSGTAQKQEETANKKSQSSSSQIENGDTNNLGVSGKPLEQSPKPSPPDSNALKLAESKNRVQKDSIRDNNANNANNANAAEMESLTLDEKAKNSNGSQRGVAVNLVQISNDFSSPLTQSQTESFSQSESGSRSEQEPMTSRPPVGLAGGFGGGGETPAATKERANSQTQGLPPAQPKANRQPNSENADSGAAQRTAPPRQSKTADKNQLAQIDSTQSNRPAEGSNARRLGRDGLSRPTEEGHDSSQLRRELTELKLDLQTVASSSEGQLVRLVIIVLRADPTTTRPVPTAPAPAPAAEK